MAVTADVVQVRLEADTARAVANIKAYDQTFTAATNNIAANAAKVNTATNAMSLNTANIAAQFQDIGVTAAMGMNPLQIALQQGTQLSAVLNQSVSQGVNPVKALGAAFVQIANPISLATIALIAAGTAAIQYFSTIMSQGDMSAEQIKKQEDAIRRVADRWGDAVPALKAYVDQLDRAANANDEKTTVSGFTTGTFKDVRDALNPILTDLAGLQVLLADAGAEAQQISQLRNAFDNLDKSVKDGTATSQDFHSVTAALAVLMSGPGASAVSELARQFGPLGSLIAAASAAMADFNAQTDKMSSGETSVQFTEKFIADQQRLNSLTADQLSLENEISRVKAQAERDNVSISDAQALALATDNIAAAERRRAEAAAARGGAKAITQAEREAAAVVEFIEQLEHEYRLLGMSNLEREVANGLRQAGATATAEQRAQIEALISATYNEQEAINALNKSSQEWADTIQQATRGFIDDLIAGKDAAEAFSNVLSSIANKLIDVGLNSLFGTGGFNLSGLFGGGRAQGGPVSANTAYMVGENGPEMFVPNGAGKIIPNGQMQGGGSVVFAPVIDARGADAGAVARIEQTMQRMAAEVVPTIRKEMATAHKKGRA